MLIKRTFFVDHMNKISKTFTKIFIMLFAIIAIAGCSKKTKKKLGITENIPDEFQVSKTNGIDVPPHFKLRNPYDKSNIKDNNDQLSQDEEAILKNIK